MYHVLISGYYGSGNLGDDAILYAITRNLRKVYPDIKITVLSMKPGETRKNYGVTSIHKANIAMVLKAVADCDILLSGGGTLLQDITSTRSIMYYLAVISLARKFGKKIVLYANGIGPILKKGNRELVKKVVDGVDLITLRDHDSLTELNSLGITSPRVIVTADPVLTLGDIAADNLEYKLSTSVHSEIILPGSEKKLIGFSLRNWKNISYEDTIAGFADYIKEKYDYDIILIPTQGSQDLEINERISRKMKHPCTIIKQENSVEEWLSLVGRLHLLISMRLHPLIFAAMQKIPMIGINWGDTKVDSFLKLISQPSAGNIHNLDHFTLCRVFDEVDRNRDHVADLLELTVRDLKNKAAENDTLVVELLQNSCS